MNEDNIMRHEYRPLTDQEKADMGAMKDAGLRFYREVSELADRTGNSRELALAKTRIEEAVMWATKHITA